MEINWILVGWIVDIVLNGIVWLTIAAFLIPIIELVTNGLEKLLHLWIKLING